MRPLGTVVAFGEAPMRDVAILDATALACEILPADFRALKEAEAGALLLLLCEAADAPARRRRGASRPSSSVGQSGPGGAGAYRASGGHDLYLRAAAGGHELGRCGTLLRRAA